ncbi:alkaline phosphatase [Phyllobacterium phragmitis]|uniref:Alkaline phosphatase n=1 Tax=Phyllobacterium phragmitis TaxID=2670329 RepID=A0A2S9ITS2_9HYPH|nr:esterase-like activity of phytase family protein [Phyllobacterium phragmitis]PRD43926.1 alkaline phosphatase [Phyllobacterium phragmitis]
MPKLRQHHSVYLTLFTILTASAAFPAAAEPVFNRIATFPVASNLPADADKTTETSSEIIAASEDGNTLVYSDSPYGGIGFVDITDPAQPKPGGSIKVDGEPTSVIVVGGKVLAGVNTSQSKVKPSGRLDVIDLATRKVEASCDLGGQPDSVAVSPDKAFLAVAIENERDEDLNDGELPQLPAGDLKIFSLKDGQPDCASMKTVALTGLAEIAPEDPEPEFVSFNGKNEIAVTLQENNHIAIVDAASGKLLSHFSAGSVDLDGIDSKSDGALTFDRSLKGVRREPDAIKWLDDERLVTANEGDYKGGSRGFTIFARDGKVLYESGPSLERRIVQIGHYPDKRSGKKGAEPEGLETATFGDAKYIFVAAERASVIGVYKDTGGEPEFVQLLPSGIAPEGLVAVPGRDLLVTANEADLVEDGGPRSHVMVYRLEDGTPAYPQIVSATKKDGSPLGWGALSGLVADPKEPGKLFAVSDSFYSTAPTIFTIDANAQPARITGALVVTRGGQPAQKIDLEGITTDGKGGFWLANEGNAKKLIPHAILHVDEKGAIKQEIALPEDVLAGQKRFGLEGITLTGEGDDATLWMAVQREWADDPKGTVKLLAYKPKSKEWTAVRYPLDKTEAGWVGLSEITAHDGQLYIVERDNQIGDKAAIKRLYRVALEGLEPAKLGGELPVVQKTLAHDFMPDLKSANGYVVDKLEGFAIDSNGKGYAVTDNDGVDDSSGETLFFTIGKVQALN